MYYKKRVFAWFVVAPISDWYTVALISEWFEYKNVTFQQNSRPKQK